MVRKIATFKMTSHSKLAMVFFVLLMLVAPAISAPIDFPAYVIPGSNWYVGTSAPTSSIGSSGDFYLQNSTGVIYQKIIGTWTAQGVLTSPAGTAINESYAYLPGRAGGQTLTGGTAANDDLILNGTSSATKTTSHVILQPDGGSVGIGFNSIPSADTLNVNGAVNISNQMKIIYSTADLFSTGFNVYKRGNNTDSNGKLVSGTELGYNSFYGWDGSNFGRGAFIVAASPSSWNTAQHAAYIRFATTNIGSITNAYVMHLGYDGKVGVGTTSPTSNFDVLGSVRLRNCTGSPTFDSGGNMTCVSDEKLKSNIQIIQKEGYLSKVLNLQPVSYKWKAETGYSTSDNNFGFIAGDVKKILPEVVKSKQDMDFKLKPSSKENTLETVEIPLGTTTDSLDDRALIAVLVNALKEEDAKVTALQEQVNTITTTGTDSDKAIIALLVDGMKEQQTQIEQLQAEVARLEGKKVDKTV